MTNELLFTPPIAFILVLVVTLCLAHGVVKAGVQTQEAAR